MRILPVPSFMVQDFVRTPKSEEKFPIFGMGNPHYPKETWRFNFLGAAQTRPSSGGRKAAPAAFAKQGDPCRLYQGLPGRFASSVLSLDTAPALG